MVCRPLVQKVTFKACCKHKSQKISFERQNPKKSNCFGLSPKVWQPRFWEAIDRQPVAVFFQKQKNLIHRCRED